MFGTKPIVVAVIDDNRLVREALTAILRDVDGVRVVAAAIADDAFLNENEPDVVLLGVGLRDTDPLAIASSLQRNHPQTKVVVMDLIPVDEEIVDYVNAGVAGFVLKDATIEEFLHTIKAVSEGEKVLPRRMTDSLFTQIAKRANGRDGKRVLQEVRMTKREHEVIELIGVGLSNKEIATRLNIATHTVKSHVRNVMEKLALHTRLQIAAYSHKGGGTD